MTRYACLTVALLAACGGSKAPGRNLELERNAPERRVAGCYALHLDRELLPRDSVFVPDTMQLTLRMDHVGVVWHGRTWRESGLFLTIRPDPFRALHSFGTWKLDTPRDVIISWGGEYGGQTIAAHVEGEGWTGMLTFVRRDRSSVSTEIMLSVTECPEQDYFSRVVTKIWREHYMKELQRRRQR